MALVFMKRREQARLVLSAEKKMNQFQDFVFLFTILSLVCSYDEEFSQHFQKRKYCWCAEILIIFHGKMLVGAGSAVSMKISQIESNREEKRESDEILFRLYSCQYFSNGT